MKTHTTRPQVANLAFHVYGRSVHPELFQAFVKKEILHDDCSVELQLGETGHLLTFQHESCTITELMATNKQPLPQRKRLIDLQIRGYKDETLKFVGGVLYQTNFQMERLEMGTFLNYHEELQYDCHSVELCHRFRTENRLSPEPLSLIRIETGVDSFLIHTFHTFPKSLSVIKTQTLIEF
ncbi:hypothetical protein MNBD_PLANCTO02-2648 [hydrothermal vent metagenome]|uniref:DUF2617 domain-containing protein n=1 Tax=hydrothermal vent metagenome TaxID=652676 RepID=A0A3B1DY83_9ZZZZ